ICSGAISSQLAGRWRAVETPVTHPAPHWGTRSTIDRSRSATVDSRNEPPAAAPANPQGPQSNSAVAGFSNRRLGHPVAFDLVDQHAPSAQHGTTAECVELIIYRLGAA